ncbi:MAG: type II toxin-antitoxin system VapC family toxin [Gammaproteobacteria bacterium]|nr:type II toxin-antitoxin system VapC family toxin [Gammaproteobacteria bacterium]MCH9743941.1 type II toxin-antitoxin system VapC family toxin [Gammaproteobacteria bacterium]
MLDNNVLVMDCSVTMALLLNDEKNSTIEKIESMLPQYSILAPTIWRYETANVLCIAERSKRITEADSTEIKNILESLPISIDEPSTTKTFGNTLHIARKYKLTVYDAAYLELSMRQGALLATFDKTLGKAAKQAGTELLQ